MNPSFVRRGRFAKGLPQRAPQVTASGIALLILRNISCAKAFSCDSVDRRHGIDVDVCPAMNAEGHNPLGAPVVRWDFARNHQHVVCTILAKPAESFYEVAIVPLWDFGCAAIETFTSATAALRRHAAIAAALRDAGWRVAAYSV
jgi:hypothetical protein